MQHYTTCFKCRLTRWIVYFVVFIATITTVAVATAQEKPPHALFQAVISSSKLVHVGLCDVPSLRKMQVECLVFVNDKMAWIVLFDTKAGKTSETHVIAAKDGVLNVAWCRTDICL